MHTAARAVPPDQRKSPLTRNKRLHMHTALQKCIIFGFPNGAGGGRAERGQRHKADRSLFGEYFIAFSALLVLGTIDSLLAVKNRRLEVVASSCFICLAVSLFLYCSSGLHTEKLSCLCPVHSNICRGGCLNTV
ncbi:unnamed protein product [Ectocarpus sp. 8 AP-2014]